MILKINSGERADIGYLFENKTAQILLGNPDQIAELIRCSPAKSRFTSVVMSFTEALEDGPLPQDREDSRGRLDRACLLFTLEMYLKLIAPGGMPERLAVLAVIHTDKGRTEIHIIVITVDLATGKQFSPYVHRRDAARMRNFQHWINSFYGLSDPDDLERQMNAMPDPRMGNFKLIRKVTRQVQKHFLDAEHVTSDEVEAFLRKSYQLEKPLEDAKKKRLALILKDGARVQLPGLWFRPDLDLEKFRAKRKKTIAELWKSLKRRKARHKKLTIKRYPLRALSFSLSDLPRRIRLPVKLKFFRYLISSERWLDRKIPVLADTLWVAATAAAWIRDWKRKLGLPSVEIETLLKKSRPLVRKEKDRSKPPVRETRVRYKKDPEPEVQ